MPFSKTEKKPIKISQSSLTIQFPSGYKYNPALHSKQFEDKFMHYVQELSHNLHFFILLSSI